MPALLGVIRSHDGISDDDIDQLEALTASAGLSGDVVNNAVEEWEDLEAPIPQLATRLLAATDAAATPGAHYIVCHAIEEDEAVSRQAITFLADSVSQWSGEQVLITGGTDADTDAEADDRELPLGEFVATRLAAFVPDAGVEEIKVLLGQLTQFASGFSGDEGIPLWAALQARAEAEWAHDDGGFAPAIGSAAALSAEDLHGSGVHELLDSFTNAVQPGADPTAARTRVAYVVLSQATGENGESLRRRFADRAVQEIGQVASTDCRALVEGLRHSAEVGNTLTTVTLRRYETRSAQASAALASHPILPRSSLAIHGRRALPSQRWWTSNGISTASDDVPMMHSTTCGKWIKASGPRGS